MKKSFFLFNKELLFFLLLSFNLSATNYYVATNGNNSHLGTHGSPWRTIQYAVDHSGSGDTIYVIAGTYSEKVLFNGGNDSGITLKNYNGGEVYIDGSGLNVDGREGLITIKDASDINISGFNLENFETDGGNTPVGFLVKGTCENIEFNNNKVYNIKNNSDCVDDCPEGAHGIAVFGTTSEGIINIKFDNNEVYDCILQSSEAFVINGNVDGFTQTNNNVHDNNNIGFDYIGYEGVCSGCGEDDRARNGTVTGNTSKNNRTNNNPWYEGNKSAGGFYVDGGHDIVFDGNTSTGNNIGVEFASEHSGKSTNNCTFRNNYVYKNTEVGIVIGGGESGNGSAENITVVNNTFYKNHGWGTEIVFQYKAKHCKIANNIFYAAGVNAFEYVESNGGYVDNTWNNNLYYNGESGPGSVSTSNPKLVNPDSNNSDNLDIQSSSPAINLGYNYGVSIVGDKDIKGHSRKNGIIDIGAHEFGAGNTGGEGPNTPSSLRKGNITNTSIMMYWNDNSSNESSFEIQESGESSGPWETIENTNPNVSSFTDTELLVGSTHFYRVRSKNSSGHSEWSNIINVTTTGSGGSDNGDSNSGLNKILNPSFEFGSGTTPTNWLRNNSSAITRDSNEHRTGSKSLKFNNPNGNRYNAHSEFVDVGNVNKIKIGGWSKSNGVGSGNYSYMIVLYVVYTDGSTSWPTSIEFTHGTHGWEKKEYIYTSSKTIKSVSLYPCLYTNGVAWFDDLFVEVVGSRSKITPLEIENVFVHDRIYPNPSSDIFNIEFESELIGNVYVNILSLDGRVLKSLIYNKLDSKFFTKINLSSQRAGVYIIDIMAGDYHKQSRLIKK